MIIGLRWVGLSITLAFTALSYAEPIKLTTGNDYKPFTDESLPEGGLVTDIVKHVFEKMEEDLALDWLPWARGYEEARVGNYAGTFPYVKNAEREKSFFYSEPLYEVRDVLFVTPGNSAAINPDDLTSFVGKSACLPLGWAPNEKLEQMLQDGTLMSHQPKDISGCVQMVAAGYADFLVTDPNILSAVLHTLKMEPAEFEELSPPLSVLPLYLIAPKSDQESLRFLERFNTALDQLKNEGVYDQIVDRHSRHASDEE